MWLPGCRDDIACSRPEKGSLEDRGPGPKFTAKNAAGEKLEGRRWSAATSHEERQQPQSKVEIYIIPTDEELMIARHTHCVFVNQPRGYETF